MVVGRFEEAQTQVDKTIMPLGRCRGNLATGLGFFFSKSRESVHHVVSFFWKMPACCD